ncbi:hypothetical protein BGZ61DRAFT_485301 [Ilyonectria robusta]|uniref:uncharacterized protein n=1 Tax=Ilyonectria robusta TaxID=1079257 RepID=UPI001E8D8FF9|nr:uncharacterized protein BGZ61DRAFT_485301 [Ilyonectria robusta]KAH8661785.1 hypothetical protein BGZ61DRAFT_485301 [Ilyonectria robusta]
MARRRSGGNKARSVKQQDAASCRLGSQSCRGRSDGKLRARSPECRGLAKPGSQGSKEPEATHIRKGPEGMSRAREAQCRRGSVTLHRESRARSPECRGLARPESRGSKEPEAPQRRKTRRCQELAKLINFIGASIAKNGQLSESLSCGSC